ncbi:hypothetical protein JCM19314_331 [Nonlabens ulvanivorans]|uniref:Uncharacterized protein n=1 Tax=Nonlabens ulvanivorans TaxID=906888 RepID=A0A090QXB2_NONUL|nr:hypothetical protein JCM19314_331 [Nonlabens ulvanivorans]
MYIRCIHIIILQFIDDKSPNPSLPHEAIIAEFKPNLAALTATLVGDPPKKRW